MNKRPACKINGLKYPAADQIAGRTSTVCRSMACTMLSREACSPVQESEWLKFFPEKTCAAPNLRERPSNPMNPHAGYKPAKVTPAELETLLISRIRRIFEVAVENEVLILGAFGCGAFWNPPEIVAKVFYDVMQDFLGYFDSIEYAIYHTEREVANYEAFQKIMNV